MGPFKHFDRILNIILVVVALLWAYQHFIQKKEPQSLTNEALAAFGEPDGNAHSEVKPRVTAEPVTYMGGKVTPIDFDQISDMIKTSDIPVALFIYTSWCPYCNKLFPKMEEIAREQDGMLRVVAVSVDENRQKFKHYIEGKTNPPPFNTYYLGAGDEYYRLMNYLKLIGLKFTGGIPYIAFFSHNQPAGRISGFVEKDKIEEMLQRVYLKSEQQPSKPTL